ncbi:MAG TPA: L,D-transpeptidase [Labilithrix sp.]|nr:L,D-transpeptidase [Labilithrix sp.]
MNALARLAMVGLFTLPLAAGAALTGCAAAEPDEEAADASEDQLRKGAAEQWVYSGTLPHLDSPSVTVSLTAHTARVSGFIPEGWTTPLPYYVDAVKEGGRTKIAVVYPIATGASVNSQPSSYAINRASPWVPTNDHATWGGFPFIPFNKGIAFHGPITAEDGEWKLRRGPVSHGCQRMQGEHVVELASLIGVDMSTTVFTGASVTGLDVPVTVLRKTDTWNGKNVDVDYPVLPGVARPTTNVKMFASWSADDLATFVCPLNKKDLAAGSKVIPAGYCARKNHDKFDAATGPR